jgi:hypothetical protein
MYLIRKLAESNAQAKLQKIDYLLGAGFIVWGLISGPWWLVLLGVVEIIAAYLNFGKVIGEKIARSVIRKRRV